MPKINCTICKKEFYVIPARIKRSKHLYCSLPCKHKGDKFRIPWNKGMANPSMNGDKNYFWKGGKYTESRGYVLIYSYDHPHKNINNYVYEHHLVMEKHLGRYLSPEERVHHINFNKSDNRIKNLKLFPSESKHQQHHWKLKKKQNQT